MSNDQSDHQWRMVRASASAWLLGMLVSVFVFFGAMCALDGLGRWAFGNRPDPGDVFLDFCVSALIAIISARIVAWLARPNKSDGVGLFAGFTGRVAWFATIVLFIAVVWIAAIAFATKF